QVDPAVRELRRAQPLRLARARRRVLARGDRELERGVVEATEAGTVEPRCETQLEEHARARLRDHELRGHPLRNGDVALARELERFQLELDLVAVLLPRTEFDRSEAEAPYEVSVAGCACSFRRAAGAFAETISTTATTIA